MIIVSFYKYEINYRIVIIVEIQKIIIAQFIRELKILYNMQFRLKSQLKSQFTLIGSNLEIRESRI